MKLLARCCMFHRRLFSYFRPDAGRIAWLLAVMVLSTLVGLAQVWPLAILVDSILTPENGSPLVQRWLLDPLGANTLVHIAVLALATFALRVVQEWLNLHRTLLDAHISHHGVLRLRCDLFAKLQSLTSDFHNAQPQGDTLYRLTQDAPGCQQILRVGLDVFIAGLTLIVMLGVMLTRSLSLTLAALAVVPLLLLTNIGFGRVLRRQSQAARDLESRLTSTAQRTVSSLILVQAFRRESCEYGRFQLAAGDSAKAWLRVQKQMAVYRLCVGLIFGGGAAVIFGYGGYLVWENQTLGLASGGMTPGDLMVFLTYLAMFYDPLCRISGAGASMQQGIAGVERVFEVLDRQPLVQEAPQAQPLPCQPRVLEVCEAQFAYPHRSPVIDGVSFTIQPGQSVAIVGSSGAGKSTLLNLLPRFCDPTRGTLKLDGIDIRDVRLADLRRHVALVLQDALLLPTSVAENIAYGRPDANLENIEAAARLAGADEFIRELPGGYDAPLHEVGKNLSGGQRQRLAIARAILTESPIIAFDEPTSALDAVHERQFVDTLQRLKGYRTIIMVSHRLSTVIHCDRILVMHHGRIIEAGTHDELLARQGHYWRMALSQSLAGDTRHAVAAAS